MRRPRIWLRWLLGGMGLVLIGEWAALTWLAPQAVMRVIRRVAGRDMVVGDARLSFPLTTTLTRIRLVKNTPQSALRIQRVVIRPQWISLTTKTLWLESLQIERPFIRLTRTASGTLRWPDLSDESAGGRAISGGIRRFVAESLRSSPWQIRVGSVQVVDGTIEFVDEGPRAPFHGVIDHLAVVVGPLILSAGGAGHPPVAGASGWVAGSSAGGRQEGVSFAVYGVLVGAGGHSSPLYCSGWFDIAPRDLEVFCRLEPLALAAFEPYYHGPAEVRVYTSTLRSTSRWTSRSNEFTARIQLELSNLSEGDLSVHGRTILDAKKLSAGPTPRLSGELNVTGPLDTPRNWHAEFVPGDEQVQQLVKRLLNRGVELIRLPLLGGRFRLSLTPGSRTAMTDIEQASKKVEEALEILAGAIPVGASESAPDASGRAEVPPSMSTEAASPSPSGTVPSPPSSATPPASTSPPPPSRDESAIPSAPTLPTP